MAETNRLWRTINKWWKEIEVLRFFEERQANIGSSFDPRKLLTLVPR
jgi:hypothetical protein